MAMRRVEEVHVDRAIAATIATLVNHAFLVEAWFVDGDRISPEAILRLAANPAGRFHVAYDEAGQIVGSVYAEVRSAGVGYFGLLAVDLGHRGEGIGHQLMTGVDHFLRSRGCHSVEITVVDLRAELFPYYEQRGYRRDGRTEAFPRDAKQPCRLIYMSKALDSA